HTDGTQVTATIGPEAYPKRGVQIRSHRTCVRDSSARAACAAGIAVFQGFLPPKERGPRRRRSAGWAAILTAVQQSERAADTHGDGPARVVQVVHRVRVGEVGTTLLAGDVQQDRKSTRLNSSHVKISYAVFCF